VRRFTSISSVFARSAEAKAKKERIIRVSKKAYRLKERDRTLNAFVEGAFFGFVTALLVITLAKPAMKTVTAGFLGYFLFVVARGLLDYNSKKPDAKG
jgi:hypothetical protein